MSLRNVGSSDQAEQVQALNREKQAGRPATLGDLLREKLGEKLSSIVPQVTSSDDKDKES
jgi:hypothetical protein